MRDPVQPRSELAIKRTMEFRPGTIGRQFGASLLAPK
jgi:hypothetical protein